MIFKNNNNNNMDELYIIITLLKNYQGIILS